MNLDKMDFVGEMAEMMKEDPEMKKMITGVMSISGTGHLIQ